MKQHEHLIINRGKAGIFEPDELLAGQAGAGSRESFDELARRYQVRLLRFLQRRVAGTADAEDLLQDTFVRAFERLRQYDPSRSFGTWIFTIAHRLAMSHHRRLRASERATGALAERATGQRAPQPDEAAIEVEDRERFWAIAAKVLSEEQVCATWLFYVEQMPAQQIAEVMGRTWVSVKTILFRARRKLAPFLDDPANRRCKAGHRSLVRRLKTASALSPALSLNGLA